MDSAAHSHFRHDAVRTDWHLMRTRQNLEQVVHQEEVAGVGSPVDCMLLLRLLGVRPPHMAEVLRLGEVEIDLTEDSNPLAVRREDTARAAACIEGCKCLHMDQHAVLVHLYPTLAFCTEALKSRNLRFRALRSRFSFLLRSYSEAATAPTPAAAAASAASLDRFLLRL